MNNRTLSIVAYITIIGWIIAFVQYSNRKSPEVRFHLKQSLGVMILGVIISIIMTIIVTIVPTLGFLNFVGLAVLLLLILGIINAMNDAQKELPLIGSLAESKITFI